VDFFGTQTYQHGRWAELKDRYAGELAPDVTRTDPVTGIDTHPGQVRSYGFVIDATGQQLMLCPFQRDEVTTSPDAQTRQECVINAVVVLQRSP
jgi:hypothetical protein